MSWAGKRHPVEVAIELVAPVVLALAVGWSSWRLGLPPVASPALGAVALAAGVAAFKLGGGAPYVPIHNFDVAAFESVEPDELLLEEKDAVLVLSDRLETPRPDSRVVRLFERQEPTPGELVDRIVDFLADGRREPAASRAGEAGPLPDASAALQDALANIRASLR